MAAINVGMATITENPIFHVTLADRDEWAVEVEWADGTLERITTFKAHFLAANWVSNRSEAWLQATSGLISVDVSNAAIYLILSRAAIQRT